MKVLIICFVFCHLCLYGTTANVLEDTLAVWLSFFYQLGSKLILDPVNAKNALVKLFPSFTESITEETNDDDRYSMYNYIVGLGYPYESHYVVTEDGYILNIFRIPHGKNIEATKGPVLVQHGLFSSSDTWVGTGPNDSLAFVLANAGYDVWIGNYRGDRYCRNHTTLSILDSKFWQFSFDQHGDYDIPATIDYVLNVTKTEKLKYVGHSMGTTGMFATLSAHPEYNKKLSIFVALAPVLTTTYASSIILRTLTSYPLIFLLYPPTTLRPGIETADYNVATEFLISGAATEFPAIARTFIDLFSGFEGNELFNQSNIGMYMTQVPLGGGSVMQIFHYGQTTLSKKFQRYDCGFFGNWQLYGQSTPPEYDLNNIDVPISLYWANNDALSSPLDAAWTLANVPGIFEVTNIEPLLYTHGSYVWGIGNGQTVFQNILNSLASK